MFANMKHPCKEEAGDCWNGKDTQLQQSEYCVRTTLWCFQSITCVNEGWISCTSQDLVLGVGKH